MTNQNKRLTTQLQNAKIWAQQNLVGKKVFHPDLKNYVEFNPDGTTHAIYAKTYPEKIEMIYHSIQLLKTSTLFAIEPDKKGRPDIKAVYKLVSNWNFNGKNYFVYIVVRETRQCHFYYDHGIIKEKP